MTIECDQIAVCFCVQDGKCVAGRNCPMGLRLIGAIQNEIVPLDERRIERMFHCTDGCLRIDAEQLPLRFRYLVTGIRLVEGKRMTVAVCLGKTGRVT